MSTDLSSINFANKLFGDGKCPADMDELVEGWIAFQARSITKAISEGRWSASSKEAERLTKLDNQSLGDDEFFWAFQCACDFSDEYPDLALEFVLEVLKKEPPSLILVMLAVGPLEEVLGNHGPTVIDRVEAEARRDEKYRQLLSDVWRHDMSDDIWERVQRLAPEKL